MPSLCLASSVCSCVLVLNFDQTAGFFPAILTHCHSRTVDLKDLVKKFIPNSIGTQIEQVRCPETLNRKLGLAVT